MMEHDEQHLSENATATAGAAEAAAATESASETARPVAARGAKVDMVGEARNAQMADSRLEPGEIRLIAPAKVNLYLEIGNKRADGYHDAVTVMHALMLHDAVRMKREPSDGDGLSVDVRCVPREGLAPLDVPPENNIAAKAVRTLAQIIGRNEREALRVIIEKHIPAEAGLGGGSSDAAAALVGAAQLWGLDPDDPRIEEAARQLGADVAFFLHGGCACLTGVGDKLHHRLAPLSGSVALIKPEGGVSTKEAYRAFDECPQAIDAADRARVLEAADASLVPLRNNLVCASELLLPALAEVRAWVQSQPEGVADALMSGSGSAVFVVCDNFAAACRVAAGARAQGWWARTTAFCSARAAAVPGR